MQATRRKPNTTPCVTCQKELPVHLAHWTLRNDWSVAYKCFHCYYCIPKPQDLDQ